jgi:hypothetical protein
LTPRHALQKCFAKAAAINQRSISWSLDAEFVVRLAIDIEAVLGYYPDSIEKFLGLPIRLLPSGHGNRLITEEGWMAVPDHALIDIRPVASPVSISKLLTHS